MPERPLVPEEWVLRLGSIALALPDAYEEPAWIGTRWRIRQRTFAHVLPVDAGWPPAYCAAVGSPGPHFVLTFRLSAEELDAVVASGPGYFRARWGRDVAGVVLDDDSDWDEVAEFVTESYCRLAPKRLAARVALPHDRPG